MYNVLIITRIIITVTVIEIVIIEPFLYLVTFAFVFVAIYTWTKMQITLQVPEVKKWPIVGSVFQMNSKRHDLSFLQWAKELGPIYSVQIFNQTLVIVSGLMKFMRCSLVKETLLLGALDLSGKNVLLVVIKTLSMEIRRYHTGHL